MKLLVKIYWVVEIISSSVAIFVTVLYWSVVHPYVMEYRLLLNEADWVYNVFLHASNTVFSLVDLLLSARPVSVYHAYLPATFGLFYSLFSLIYWQLGGRMSSSQSDHQSLSR